MRTETPGIRVVPSNSAVMFPIGPFRKWLNTLAAGYRPQATRYYGVNAMLAARLNVTRDCVEKWRNSSMEWIREDAVDRACCYEGSIHVADLYPQYWQIAPTIIKEGH